MNTVICTMTTMMITKMGQTLKMMTTMKMSVHTRQRLSLCHLNLLMEKMEWVRYIYQVHKIFQKHQSAHKLNYWRQWFFFSFIATCEKCGAVGIKHAFYSKSKRFCSLSCSRSFATSQREGKQSPTGKGDGVTSPLVRNNDCFLKFLFKCVIYEDISINDLNFYFSHQRSQLLKN